MSNEYDSWTGAGEISASRLFDAITRQELDQSDSRYEVIMDYLPRASDASVSHYFIGRVATTSHTTGQEIVKLFTNRSWNPDLQTQLEAAEFVKVGANLEQLQSLRNLQLTVPSPWKVNAKMFVFRDLNPPGNPYRENHVRAQGWSIR